LNTDNKLYIVRKLSADSKKDMKKIFSVLVIGLAFSFLFVPVIRGAVVTTTGEERVAAVPKNQVVNDDLFITGQEVLVEGTVNGDVYAAGGMVRIRGTVNGDVLAAGGNVEISGKITQDIRAAGGNVRIDEAQVGDSVTVVGGNISIDKETKIGGGLVFGGGSIDSQANVGRGITGGGGAVTLDGIVAKDIQVGAGALTLGSGAKVNGDLIYSSEEEPRFVGEATVSGKIRKVIPSQLSLAKELRPQYIRNVGQGIFRGLTIGFRIWSYFAALIVGLVILKLFPKESQIVAETVEKKLFSSLGWGFLIFLLAGPAFILGMVTLVGIPLTLILFMLLLIDLYIAKVFIGLAIGNWLGRILNQKVHVYVSFAVGLAVYTLLHTARYIGFFVEVVGCLAGLGALVIYARSVLQKRTK